MQVLQHRIATMLAQGRPVVLVGDLNIAPHMLDHCDWCGKASQPSAQRQFLHQRPDRQWFQSILTTGGGPLTDVFRKFHANRSAPFVFCYRHHHIVLCCMVTVFLAIGCIQHIFHSLNSQLLHVTKCDASFSAVCVSD